MQCAGKDLAENAIPTGKTILALNSGSSSLKLSLYEFQNGTPSKLASGAAEEIGSASGRITLKRNDEVLLQQNRAFSNSEQAAEFLFATLKQNQLPEPDVIGHRIVHGGPQLGEHQVITARVLNLLQAAVPFAPLHLPAALEVVHYTKRRFPKAAQVACFDTAFHTTLPEHAARLPFSDDLWKKGLRRYGFHGLSFEFIVQSLSPRLPGKVVVAHLGNGCSLCAVRDGQSIDTTMGLTPTGGVMMGTRSGDLDPGVLLHLLQAEKYTAEKLDGLVNHEAGLRGVSGTSSDMRQLLADGNNKDANLAVEMFCYSIAKFMGAMAAALGGIDLLVFTAGIGEHSAKVRSGVCLHLEHLGIVLDEAANDGNADIISAANSRCLVRVIPTDEDIQIARHCFRLAVDPSPHLP